jgi:hypothetical protein
MFVKPRFEVIMLVFKACEDAKSKIYLSKGTLGYHAKLPEEILIHRRLASFH